MKIEGKVWGTTVELHRTQASSVHYLEIKAGGVCSEHRHVAKTNLFQVLDGELEVTTWYPGATTPDTTILTRGMEAIVEPGTWHRFRARTDCRAVEVYLAPHTLLEPDIERRTQGYLEGGLPL